VTARCRSDATIRERAPQRPRTRPWASTRNRHGAKHLAVKNRITDYCTSLARRWSRPERRVTVTSAEIVERQQRATPLRRPAWDHPALRALNVSIAAVSLVAAAPLMIVISVAIKLTSPGPVLYRQIRVGVDRRGGDGRTRRNRRQQDAGGLPFLMYKFRTMHVNGDGKERETWAQPNDPRVTPVGRVLRSTRLDELPQLINVLRGDMNVVGPRPEQMTIFADLRQQIDRYGERQRVRPGITGLAQIRHRYDQSLDDVRTKLAHDLEYIENRSLLQELTILLWTPFVMLFKRGSH